MYFEIRKKLIIKFEMFSWKLRGGYGVIGIFSDCVIVIGACRLFTWVEAVIVDRLILFLSGKFLSFIFIVMNLLKYFIGVKVPVVKSLQVRISGFCVRLEYFLFS